jgi:hypothetical protein
MILVLAERVYDPNMTDQKVEAWRRAWQQDRTHCIFTTPAMYRGDVMTRLRGHLGFEPVVRNLLWPDNQIGTWDRGQAKLSALAVHQWCKHQADLAGVIFLGRKVTAAFGRGYMGWGEVQLLDLRSPPLRLLALPHPSGRNRIWNDPAMRRALKLNVAKFLLEVYNGCT